ncbi:MULTISPECIES: hypothetical protein [unclassified Leucobacter]|uniref:hypothetical protein n=1 Tax=unclassified Leucobacter TaxID=2621730 RepID=UPI001E2ED0D0|nr:hypothetical protein [Leucobacter sp. Ag1]
MNEPDFRIIAESLEALGVVDWLELVLGFASPDDMESFAPLLQALSDTASAAAERTVSEAVTILRMMRSHLFDESAGADGRFRR